LLLRIRDYPGYAAHKAEHDAYRKKAVSLRLQYDRRDLGIRIANFLTIWWGSHILTSDQQYARFFQCNRTNSGTRSGMQAYRRLTLELCRRPCRSAGSSEARGHRLRQLGLYEMRPGSREMVAILIEQHPVDRKGPWQLKDSTLAAMPSVPCVTCRQMHREGNPMDKVVGDGSVPGPSQEMARPSLALFDPRTQQYIPAAELPIPVRYDGARAVKMSPDQRQAVCYQCHAPLSTALVGSGRPHRDGRPRRDQLYRLPRAARGD
jgi:hypothetical protein